MDKVSGKTPCSACGVLRPTVTLDSDSGICIPCQQKPTPKAARKEGLFALIAGLVIIVLVTLFSFLLSSLFSSFFKNVVVVWTGGYLIGGCLFLYGIYVIIRGKF